MIKAFVVFTAAFGACAALSSMGTGCSATEEEGPNCTTPNRPPAVSGLRFFWVTTEGDAARAIEPLGGTVESRGDTMVIRYREDTGVTHEIVYAIDGPWPRF